MAYLFVGTLYKDGSAEIENEVFIEFETLEEAKAEEESFLRIYALRTKETYSQVN